MKKTIMKLLKKVARPFLGRGLGGNFLGKYLCRLLVTILSPINLEGDKFYLHPLGGIIFITGAYQKFSRELFKKQIKKGDVVLDIGANIGYHTLPAARLVGQKGKVYAFEPDPVTFTLLKRNVEKNNYQNVILEQKAVTNRTGKDRLYLWKDSVHNRLYDSEKSLSSIEIETVMLDDYFKDHPNQVDLIKIDVLGNEGQIILGMTSLLKKNPQLKIIMEFCPYRIKEYNLEPIECLKTLKDFGFEIYKINSEKEGLEPIDRIETLVEINQTSSLFCKR